MKRREYSYTQSFTDLLFNILIGVMFLLVLAVILINPIVKRDAVVKKNAEFILQIDWPSNVDCDVDVWIRDPKNKILSFKNKSTPVMHLERDDLGHTNDSFAKVNGETITIKENKEIVTFRGFLAGEYIVNMHVYSCKFGLLYANVGDDIQPPLDVIVTLDKVNPTYETVYKTVLSMTKVWEEQNAFIFELDEKGKTLSVSRNPNVSIIEVRKE